MDEKRIKNYGYQWHKEKGHRVSKLMNIIRIELGMSIAEFRELLETQGFQHGATEHMREDLPPRIINRILDRHKVPEEE